MSMNIKGTILLCFVLFLFIIIPHFGLICFILYLIFYIYNIYKTNR